LADDKSRKDHPISLLLY